MAISTLYQPKTSLNLFAKLLGINPLAFNSISMLNCIETPHNCSTWLQFDWQNSSFISREMLANFLVQAEQEIEHYLQMFVKPTFVKNEVHTWPRNYRIARGKTQSAVTFQTNWRNIIEFGQEGIAEFVTDITLNYVDRDGDGFAEFTEFSMQLPGNFDKIQYIYVTFPDVNGNKQYEIIPETITDLGNNTYRFTFFTWNLVKIELATSTALNQTRYLDGCDSNIFTETVEVWYQAIDECKPQVEMVWTNDDICRRFNCSEYVQPACAISIDKCDGLFNIEPLRFDDDGCVIHGKCHCPSEPPDFIRVFYLSGCYDEQKIIKTTCDTLALAVTKLAASKFPLQLCHCQCIISELQRLQIDTAVSQSGMPRYDIPYHMRSNPFGTTVGGIEVYRLLNLVFDTVCS